MPNNTFENFIRQHCRQQKLSLEKVADLANMSRSTFYNILKDNSCPKISQLIALAHAMNVHYSVLLQLKWSETTPIPAVCLDEPMALNYADHHLDISGFIDETIPDGTIVAMGNTFVKTWTIQNIGNVVWHNRKLVCIDEIAKQHEHNQLLPNATEIIIPTTKPKESITLEMTFTAPHLVGRHISYWKMIDENGQFCFPNGVGLSCAICVKSLNVCH